MPSKYRILTHEQLKNLKLYKYSAIDKSPFSRYILQPYWEWSLQWFPKWMAPNLITLIGFMFVVINALLVCAWVIPDLSSAATENWWIYYCCAAGLWLYSTFDNVDGKQARRTGTSSPLGELFDHGCDALNCSFGALVQAGCMGLGFGWYTVYVLFLAVFAFYFSTWEEYWTGTMYLGYINGPSEGLTIACGIMIISGIFGPSIWHTAMIELLPVGSTATLKKVLSFGGERLKSHSAHDILSNTKLVDVVAICMAIMLLAFHCPMSVWNVYRFRCKNPDKVVSITGDMRTIRRKKDEDFVSSRTDNEVEFNSSPAQNLRKRTSKSTSPNTPTKRRSSKAAGSSYQNNGGYGTVMEPWFTLLPIFSYLMLGLSWLTAPRSYIFGSRDLVVFALGMGLLFGWMASSIILAYVTRSRFPKLHRIVWWLLIPIVVLYTFEFSLGYQMYKGLMHYVLKKISMVDIRLLGTAILYSWVSGIFIGYSIWIYNVANDMCDFMGIKMFKI